MSNHATKEHGPRMIAAAVPSMATAGPLRADTIAIMRVSVEVHAPRTAMGASGGTAAMMGMRMSTRPAGFLARLMALKPSTAIAGIISMRIDPGAGESMPRKGIAAGRVVQQKRMELEVQGATRRTVQRQRSNLQVRSSVTAMA